MIQLLKPSKNFLTYLAINNYSLYVTEKEVARYESLNYKKAHRPRNAVFLRAYAVACLLWAAVVGGFGLLVFFFVPVSQPAICRPPYLRVGSGLTVQKGTHHA